MAPAGAAKPTKPAKPAKTGALANTGSDTQPVFVLGLGLLAAGAALVLRVNHNVGLTAHARHARS